MKKIALFLSIVVATIACEKVDPVTPPEFDFANPDVLIPYQGSEDESLKLAFTVNVDWTAELDNTYDWVMITPKSGKAGEASITVVATPNKGTDPRTAVITVKAGVSVLTFDVVQEGYPSLSISPKEVVLPVAGGTAEVAVSANVEYAVSMPEVDWLSVNYDAQKGAYVVTATENTAYAGRSVTITLSNNVDNVSESVVISQDGKAKVVWEKTLADLSIAPGNPLHLAYKDGLLALSTGSALHAINAADGAYKAPVALPEGFIASSMTMDDAGNIVLAGDIPFGGSGDVYAVSSLAEIKPVKVAVLSHVDVWSNTAGNLRAGGDVTKNGVVTMIVDVSQYWIGCDIVDGVAGATTFGALANPEAGTLWSVANGCVAPLGNKLADGLLATYYTCPALYSNAAGEWAPVGGNQFTGNDNNCAIAEAVYGGNPYAAVAVGSHFNYSATGACLYDLAKGEMVYKYSVEGELNNAGATADVILVPAADALYMYYADLNKGKVACIEIK